jgi:hypothetical protein
MNAKMTQVIMVTSPFSDLVTKVPAKRAIAYGKRSEPPIIRTPIRMDTFRSIILSRRKVAFRSACGRLLEVDKWIFETGGWRLETRQGDTSTSSVRRKCFVFRSPSFAGLNRFSCFVSAPQMFRFPES